MSYGQWYAEVGQREEHEQFLEDVARLEAHRKWVKKFNEQEKENAEDQRNGAVEVSQDC